MRPGEVQMWRIVNTASKSSVNFVGPPAGFSWKQIAQDGIQLSDVNYQANENQSFLMAPGNRVDLLVKAPTTAPATATSVMVQEVLTRVGLTDSTPTPIPLLSIEVSGTPPAAPNQAQFIPKAPVFPAFLADITDKEVQGTKTIVYNTTTFGAPAQHTIDGKQFDDHIGAAVLLNKVEEWKIENKTTADTSQGVIDHPFHIHINPFQIVEVFDPNQNVTDPATGTSLPLYIFDPAARKSDVQCLLDPRGNPDNWKPCEDSWGTGADLIWWDVFPIPAGVVAKNAAGDKLKDADGNPLIIPGYFKMRSRFVDFPGEFVMHCHILAHEDRGMMTIVAVMSDIPTVRHH
jgi:FtsP/CotA-like multicopper oxidase with cupredoxin domain